MKENRKSRTENDSGATFVNWLLVRSEAMQKCNLCWFVFCVVGYFSDMDFSTSWRELFLTSWRELFPMSWRELFSMWLLQPSPEHGITKTPVRGASTLGLNVGADDTHMIGGGGCEQFSPSMYLLKECR
jgi:hypothetical protein